MESNFDDGIYNHTVGCAVLCKNGNIYKGVNCDGIHGSCAEYITIGIAISNGEREFDTIVAVHEKHLNCVIPPCGNCRQMLFEYCPDIKVIVNDESGKISVKVDGEVIDTVSVTDGTADVIIPSLSAGNHTVEIIYSGDEKYSPANETKEITVSKQEILSRPIQLPLHPSNSGNWGICSAESVLPVFREIFSICSSGNTKLTV